MANLYSRLDRLERRNPAEPFRPYVVQIVTTDEEEAAAHKALEASGYVPRPGEVAVIRLVGVPAA